MKIKRNSVRLSKNIIPMDYDIQLKPDLENFTFSGFETITLSILEKTKTLTLHSKEIEIQTADIAKKFAKISYDKKSETATFSFPEFLPAGKVKLKIFFRGILNDKMRGFYRSCYNVDGKECVMATTQFEATDARRAFPCIDEPAQKAIFNVSLVVPKGKTAISNTLPISVAEHEAGYEIIKFSPTPKMSTYLLAFIVGDFEFLERKSKNGTIVRVFTTAGKKHQAKFALECAVKTLEFYEKYFNIPFPLPELDMIAIPDFASGAMENWGAITYRESALLVDEEHSSTSNKQWVALVVAHELAHQWFGNLVTMEWWTHLWLNEGFASFIEYLAVDKLFPKWDIWTHFATDDLGRALRLDALESTHPIEVEVHHPDEIGEIFDAVSYSKGASVIRMLAEYLGEENFRNGLRYYLKKYSYKNAETTHLWQAFEKVSGKSVAKMMDDWTKKPGYPVIKISKDLIISQERFFASPVSKRKNKMRTVWQVPLAFVSEDFLKMNFGEVGFYRTAYDEPLLQRLVSPVSTKELPARDRLGIIRDLFALAESGDRPSVDALKFLTAYENEDNYTVWVEIASGLARFEQLLAHSKSKATASGGVPQNAVNKLDALSRQLFSPLVEKLGWQSKDGEAHSDILLRSLAISRAGRAGDKKVISEARKKFLSLQKGGHISPDIRGAIYSIIATWGDMKEYETLVKMYKKETLHEEKNRIGGNLGDFQNPKILQLACEFAMSPHVRQQDSIGILSNVGANPIGRDIWWNFMKKNWKTFVSRYGEGGLTLSSAVKAIGGSAETKHLKSFKQFFQTHKAPGAKRAIDQVLERLEGNIAWLKRDGKIIEKFLKAKN
ncbi:MAG: M1 family metallopeptidase [Minisyncoccia bacterium]